LVARPDDFVWNCRSGAGDWKARSGRGFDICLRDEVMAKGRRSAKAMSVVAVGEAKRGRGEGLGRPEEFPQEFVDIE